MAKNGINDKIKKVKLYYRYFSSASCTYSERCSIERKIPNFKANLNQIRQNIEAHERGIIRIKEQYLDAVLDTFRRLVTAEKIRGFRNEMILIDFRSGVPVNVIADRYGVTQLTVKNAIGF